jgi:integrase
VGNVHHFLHAALEQARKWKLISENPARDARAPSAERSRVRALTTEEVQRLLSAAAAEPETYAMVAAMLIGGLRRSELLGLAFDAIDLEAGTLEVRRTVVEVGHRPVVRNRAKTDSGRRKLRIPAELVTLFRAQLTRVQGDMLRFGREYRRETLFVFPGPAGARMGPMALTRRLRLLLHQAGITGVQPCHAWRHTAATLLLDAGQNIKVIQNRLGHSAPSITMDLYVHPVDERDAEARSISAN